MLIVARVKVQHLIFACLYCINKPSYFAPHSVFYVFSVPDNNQNHDSDTNSNDIFVKRSKDSRE